MLGLSPLELTVIALLVILLFGTKRLPELGAGLGKAINNFKSSYKETNSTLASSGQTVDVSSDSKKENSEKK